MKDAGFLIPWNLQLNVVGLQLPAVSCIWSFIHLRYRYVLKLNWCQGLEQNVCEFKTS